MIPQINIQSQLGSIGIRYNPTQFQIHSQAANLSIQSPTAQLSIQTIPGDLEIDQTAAFNQEGLMSPLTLARDQSAKAQQTAAQGVVDTAQWGNRFADLAHHSASLGDYAIRAAGNLRQFAPALIPSPFSVHITYRMSQLKITAQPQPVHIDAQTHPFIRMDAQPGTAKTYVETPPSLQITTPTSQQLFDAQA